MRIVRALWRYPGLSRADTADRLGLDRSTVTMIVNRLIKQGIIHETSEGPAGSHGGRKPIALEINRDYGCVMGIEVQNERCAAVLVNLSGDILHTCNRCVPINNETFHVEVRKAYGELRAKISRSQGKLIGVGIGIGGVVNPTRGTVLFSHQLQISSPTDLAKELGKHIDAPVFIENDANCCAQGELTFHKALDLKNILFVLVEFRRGRFTSAEQGTVGVGFGLVLNGRVHHGDNHSAGEFQSVFCNREPDRQFSLPQDVLARVPEDPAALGAFAQELARNIALIVNVIDINQVFIGGDIENCGVDFPAILRARTEESWAYPLKKKLKIQYSSMGDKAVAYGAAGMILDWVIATHRFPLDRTVRKKRETLGIVLER